MNRRVAVVLGLFVLVVAVVLVVRLRKDSTSELPAVRGQAAAGATSPASAGPVPQAAPSLAVPEGDSEAERIAAASAQAPRYPVDLAWLRTRLPDNLFWERDAPTSDPEVAKARAERARRSNEVFGRVQTGEASEEEIRTYYADRRKVSQDYLDLAQLVLTEKGEELPPRDRGMFDLSAKMHRDRLAQIERDLADALARRQAR